MNIGIKYEQAAAADDRSFFELTGIQKTEFYLLLPHFDIKTARVLTHPQKLFAVLYAIHKNMDGTSVGKLVPFVNHRRDGNIFLEKAKIALASARVAIQQTVIPVSVISSAPVTVAETPQLSQSVVKNPVRKKTSYDQNMAMSLAHHHPDPLDAEAIIEHAQRRVDLFFYTLIAYYKTGLTINIHETNLQHGIGKDKTAACHSSILPSLWETETIVPAHSHDTKHNPLLLKRKASILEGSHFYNSLNSTVELHQSVNYFETHYIEGKCSEDKMRTQSLNILNRVSKNIINPIQGMLEFLVALNANFDSVQNKYLTKEELKTSPKETRALIFDCEKKGSFHSNWHENAETSHPTLNDDYIKTILKLTKEDMVLLEKQQSETNEAYLERYNSDQNSIHEKRYLSIKCEIGLMPILAPEQPLPIKTILERPATTTNLLGKQGFFARSDISLIERGIRPCLLSTPIVTQGKRILNYLPNDGFSEIVF